VRELRQEIKETTGPKRARSIKRLEVAEAFRKSQNRPEWMVLDMIPVIPRSSVRWCSSTGAASPPATSTTSTVRIINRNNRLKKIKALHAPESIINHEKRLLQEAVDALIDNGRRSRPVTGSNNRPLKSLSDMLKGKEGRFRKNLLGKRVDYSGRSVIVVNPHLRLHQCGLPKEMALELFKPFVMKRLVERGFTTNVKTAKEDGRRMRPEVWGRPGGGDPGSPHHAEPRPLPCTASGSRPSSRSSWTARRFRSTRWSALLWSRLRRRPDGRPCAAVHGRPGRGPHA